MANIADTDIANQKSTLRAAALALRDALPAAERQAAAETVAARGVPIEITPGMIVSGFSAMKTEINPVPLMKKVAALGAQLALPCIAGRGKPLIMRAWNFGDPLKAGQWGIREPVPEVAEVVVPDVFIVPLAAFDRAGHRIGYGAGYYDMTIHAARAVKPVVAIGIAFAAQEIPRVPATDRDERLDFVLTEKEVIDFR